MEHKKKRGRPTLVQPTLTHDARDLANDFSELIDRLLVTQEAHRLPWQSHGLIPAKYIHLGIDRIMAEHGYTPTNNIEQL